MPQYGHTNGGVNIANMRTLTQSTRRQDVLRNGYRPPYDWANETSEDLAMGESENKLSRTLRAVSGMVKEKSAAIVLNDLAAVESALRQKIRHTESLRNSLEQALTEVVNEIEMCHSARVGLEDRLRKVQLKIELNNSRMQTRNTRPGREKTMDNVERDLINQNGLLQSFADKVNRAISHVDKEIGMLEQCKAKIEADLKDKDEALRVDEAVLAMPADGKMDTSAFRRKQDCVVKTPHTWVRMTEENVANAKHWVTDSQRLRKAIRHAMESSRNIDHEMNRNLNSSMLAKIQATRGLKGSLLQQLDRVADERAKAEAERKSLAAALEAKRGPLNQAKERFALRKARPCREFVQDDVEAALAKEIAHLNAVTSQLSEKVRAVDKEIAALDSAQATLEDNLRDKDGALDVDEKIAMMDGRIQLYTAPPSSVASFAGSGMSAVRTATMKRIMELEAELMTARKEREAMEDTIHVMRKSFGSPSGPLSPSALRSPRSPCAACRGL